MGLKEHKGKNLKDILTRRILKVRTNQEVDIEKEEEMIEVGMV